MKELGGLAPNSYRPIPNRVCKRKIPRAEVNKYAPVLWPRKIKQGYFESTLNNKARF